MSERIDVILEFLERRKLVKEFDCNENRDIITFPEIKITQEQLEVISEPLTGLTPKEMREYWEGKIHGNLLLSQSAFTTREDQPEFQHLVDLGVQSIKYGINEVLPGMALRPLSELVTGVIHPGTGKAFSPLLTLFQMLDKVDYVDYAGQLDISRLQIDDEWNHCITFEDGDDYVTFSYGRNSFSLMVNDEVQTITNQLTLFRWMIEWRFVDMSDIPAI